MVYLNLYYGLQHLLDELLENNILMAIATSARKKYFNFIMDELHIRSYFNVALTAEYISKGKPDPFKSSLFI